MVNQSSSTSVAGEQAALALLQQADAQPGCRLALLVAPPGWGKTRALRRWAAARRAPAAWVTISPADNAPGHFLASVTGALAGAPGTPCGTGSPDDMAAVIVDALLAAPAGLALVLDDYPLIVSAAVHDALAIVLDYLPPHVLVVIAGRVPPPLPIARLRARRQMMELEVGWK